MSLNKLYDPITRLSMSHTFSLIAGNMGSITIGWWAANKGGIVDLSIFTSAYLLFSLILLPALSPVGDRFSRINVYGISFLPGVVYYLIWGMGLFDLGYARILVVAMAFLNACAMSVVGPIRMAIFVDARSNIDAKKVMAFQRFTDNIGRGIGPIMAGALCATWGYQYAYFMQLAFFIVAVIFYIFSRSGFANVSTYKSTKKGLRGWLADIAFGFHLRFSSTGQVIFTTIMFLYTASIAAYFSVLLPHIILLSGHQSTLLGVSISASFVGSLIIGAALLSTKFPCRKLLVPLTICLSCICLVALVISTRQEIIITSAFLIGCSGEIYLQKIGYRMILTYQPQERSRMAASGQFIFMAGIAIWCWLLVSLDHYLGITGAIFILVSSCIISLILTLHPIVSQFLGHPDNDLDKFWVIPQV